MAHIQLFQPSLIKRRLGEFAAIPEQHLGMLKRWQEGFESGRLHKIKEVSLHGEFLTDIFGHILGYDGVTSADDGIWNCQAEIHIAGAGQADAGLGFISEHKQRLVAPLELKGAMTSLDHTMSRGYTPVQQAWRYANAVVGCRWVLVSNYKELRLYATSRTPSEYESFEISKLTEPAEYWRLQLLLSKANFLAGNIEEDMPSTTDRLLEESGAAEKAITKRLYHDYRSIRSDLFAQLCAGNAEVDDVVLISAAQKILDRVLFIAFAEDVGLLPHNILLKAFESSNAFNPAPIWHNFQGLFQAVDKGNAVLNIPAYNGGLFAPDALLDGLSLPASACEHFKALAAYDFASEVSVTVLGHIFEQSITDLEEMKSKKGDSLLSSVGKSETVPFLPGKRKTDGVFYTPDAITRFIVDETIGGYLKQQFDALKAKQTGRSSKKRDIAFWETYRDEILKNLKVCDPACGSGAFLVAAFDYLHAEYRRVSDALYDLTGGYSVFDLNKTILTQNIYGVDINPESIEISKLSLWLKTAEQGKPLTSLDANIQQGNSLLDDAFDWQAAFPDVFVEGGFDIILGNPPYVRQELIKHYKADLEANYSVYHGVADLYAYFFERGIKLLKDNGRLGYISSSTFFKTASGKPLRHFLNQHVALETIVDFGDMQVFEGATTYPAILIMQKIEMDSRLPPEDNILLCNSPNRGNGESMILRHSHKNENPKSTTTPVIPAKAGIHNDIAFIDALKVNDNPTLADVLTATRNMTSQSSLSDDGWRLEDKNIAKLRTKLMNTGKSLKETCGSPLYGIKTGFNEAFVIDRQTKDKLIAQDAKSTILLKPMLFGRDLKTWCVGDRGLWLIRIAKGWTREQSGFDNEVEAWAWLQQHYPAISQWLEPFNERANKRGDKGEFWWELRACSYYASFESEKVFYPDISAKPNFSLDKTGYYCETTCYFVATGSRFILGVLNSTPLWFLFKGIAPAVRGGFYRFKSQYVETLPIPKASKDEQQAIADIAAEIQGLAEARFKLAAGFRHRMACDLGGVPDAKLNKKLQSWFELDAVNFRKEIKKSFKTDIPLAERSDWEAYLQTESQKVANFTQSIQQQEAKLNQLVYALFKLTDKDIALLEQSLDG